MRFRRNLYKYEVTIKFKDRNEAFYFAILLKSLSSFLNSYAKNFRGDEETPKMIEDVSKQIRDYVIYEN